MTPDEQMARFRMAFLVLLVTTALLLLVTCGDALPPPPHTCGYRYTAFRWDSIAPTTWRLVATDSVRECR